MLIAIINQSTQVSDADVLTMTAAIQSQVQRHVAPVWDRPPATVTSYGTLADKNELAQKVPRQAHGITIVDTIPDAPDGVLGYHTEDQGGKIWGIVATSPSLDHGANVLTGDWSVSSILSHEVLEMFVDPNCNLWANDGNGRNYSVEVCDPVEAPTYAIDGVAVSNFVTPAWFDPNADANLKTIFDHLGVLSQQFSRVDAGYFVYESAGKEQQEGGEKIPAWRMEAKKANVHFSRTHRRAPNRVES